VAAAPHHTFAATVSKEYASVEGLRTLFFLLKPRLSSQLAAFYLEHPQLPVTNSDLLLPSTYTPINPASSKQTTVNPPDSNHTISLHKTDTMATTVNVKNIAAKTEDKEIKDFFSFW
jgi:hypothetical protein